MMSVYDEMVEKSILSPDPAVEVVVNNEKPCPNSSESSDGQRSDTNEVSDVKERPKSMPPDATDSCESVTYRADNPNGVHLRSESLHEKRRPVPKPRPRTVFLKRDSIESEFPKVRTMSAENLLKSIPAIDRVSKDGQENSAPPVPLKRAQMYRSQERIGSNGFSSENSAKESKF